jgi:hypothetical protein
MTRARSERKSTLVGYNTTTGSPVKLRKRNKKTRVRKPAGNDADNSAPGLLSKRRGKAKTEIRLERNTVLMGGEIITLPPPTMVGSTTQECTAGHPTNTQTSLNHCMLDNDNEATHTEITDIPDIYESIWESALPKESVRRHKRAEAGPKWRTYVLPRLVIPFLEVEGRFLAGESVPHMDYDDTAEESQCQTPGCQKRLRETMVECIDRTGVSCHHTNSSITLPDSI